MKLTLPNTILRQTKTTNGQTILVVSMQKMKSEVDRILSIFSIFLRITLFRRVDKRKRIIYLAITFFLKGGQTKIFYLTIYLPITFFFEG